MANETPKPMKKVPRNIFRKLGKKLEQNLGASNSNFYHDVESSSSSNDFSPDYHHSYSEYDQEQDDNISLQHLPHPYSESPKSILRHKHADQLSQDRSSVISEDLQDYGESIMKNSSTQYDQEMKIICQELMENQTEKLYDCRDYDKKVALLRIAISFNTTKVIVPVILFLETTLSKPLFFELIKQHPSAIKNYINLSKLRLENDHYIAMLKQFGKNEDVAMIRIRQASEIDDIKNKMALIDQATIELVSHTWWYLQMIEYQNLLQKQRELQRYLASTHSSVHLENRTVLQTYKIVYDIEFRQQKYKRNIDGTIAERIKQIETEFHISPEMILCGKLSVIMTCGYRVHYEDFLHEVMHQGIFGKKYLIAPENFADMVYNWIRISGEGHEKANEKAEKFLNMIRSPERRIYYAEKFQNYDVAIDTITSVLRDRIQLENLRRRIPQDHPSFHRATSLLENTKWRN